MSIGCKKIEVYIPSAKNYYKSKAITNLDVQPWFFTIPEQKLISPCLLHTNLIISIFRNNIKMERSL